jgi:hypothetical protein
LRLGLKGEFALDDQSRTNGSHQDEKEDDETTRQKPIVNSFRPFTRSAADAVLALPSLEVRKLAEGLNTLVGWPQSAPHRTQQQGVFADQGDAGMAFSHRSGIVHQRLSAQRSIYQAGPLWQRRRR